MSMSEWCTVHHPVQGNLVTQFYLCMRNPVSNTSKHRGPLHFTLVYKGISISQQCHSIVQQSTSRRERNRRKMKLIFNTIALTMFCVMSHSAPILMETNCIVPNSHYEQFLKTGLRILDDVTVKFIWYVCCMPLNQSLCLCSVRIKVLKDNTF